MSAFRRLILTGGACLLAACATTNAPPAPSAAATPATVTAPSPGAAANDNLNAVAWTQTAVNIFESFLLVVRGIFSKRLYDRVII